MTALEHVGFAPGDVYLYEFDTAAGFRVNLHDSTCIAVEHRPVERAVTLRFALDALGEDVVPDTRVAVLRFDDVAAFATSMDAAETDPPSTSRHGQVSNLEATGDYVELSLLDHEISFRARCVSCSIEPHAP